MAVVALVGVVAERAAEAKDRLDMAELRQHDVAAGLDRVVEAQDRAVMRVVGREGLGIRPLGVEDRQHMGDRPRAVGFELLEAADGEERDRGGLHQGLPEGSDRASSTAAPDVSRETFSYDLPLPACGERVGVRGRGIHSKPGIALPRPLTRSPSASRPLPASRGEVF